MKARTVGHLLADDGTLSVTTARLYKVTQAPPLAAAVALYTVAIPNQSFQGGVVLVSLTEGYIARPQVATNR